MKAPRPALSRCLAANRDRKPTANTAAKMVGNTAGNILRNTSANTAVNAAANVGAKVDADKCGNAGYRGLDRVEDYLHISLRYS